jgi:hypothetical protein
VRLLYSVHRLSLHGQRREEVACLLNQLEHVSIFEEELISTVSR